MKYNMKIIIIFLLLVIQFTENSATTSTTLKIHERIRLLKKQIRNSLRHPSPVAEPQALYYESDENAPIKPILDDDELKKDDKFKMKRLKTGPTPSLVTPKSLLRSKPSLKIRSAPSLMTHKFPLRPKTSFKIRSAPSFVTPKFLRRPKPTLKTKSQNIAKKLKFSVKTTDIPNVLTPTTPFNGTSPKLSLNGFNIYYRRAYDKNLLDTTQEWMHCSEHVTPYLKGVKKELTSPKRVQVKDDIVHRLYVLISTNTTRMTRAEKKSSMYQISKLKIRLYSWDIDALKNLTITISRLHGRSLKIDFSTIRKGLIKLLEGWQADISNHTVLLRYASVFRPPCIPRGEKGSSKLVRGSTLSTAPTPQPLLDECVRRDAYDNCED